MQWNVLPIYRTCCNMLGHAGTLRKMLPIFLAWNINVLFTNDMSQIGDKLAHHGKFYECCILLKVYGV